jgi:hypothetical protein
MGIFQSIFGISSKGRRLGVHQRRLENAQAQRSIDDIQRQQDTRVTEDPREQASLKQGLWGRGLGKSTIAEQDTQRLTEQQGRRNDSLAQAHQVAQYNKEYLKFKQKYDRESRYYALVDSIISVAAGAGGGAKEPGPNAGSGGGGGGDGGGYNDYGGYGDYGYSSG